MISKIKKEKIPEFFASLYYELASLNYQLYIDVAKELKKLVMSLFLKMKNL
jgi:hypothetical protein